MRPVPAILVLASLLATSATADAGWVVVKNETKQTLLIVEVGGQVNKPIQGKPVKLQPGETYREFQSANGQKQIAIYDSTNLNAPIAKHTLAWQTDDCGFALRGDAKQIKIAPMEVAKK